MTFDKRDAAIISASALVGYCQSAPGLLICVDREEGRKALENWINGLSSRATATAAAIDAVFAETTSLGG